MMSITQLSNRYLRSDYDRTNNVIIFIAKFTFDDNNLY